MDHHVAAGEATLNGARARRRRMRDLARSQPAQRRVPASDRYQTPQWLERSFVLPHSPTGPGDVPSQGVRHHDDNAEPTPETSALPRETVAAATPPAAFVRPATDNIDFAKVVRRAELCRKTGRVAKATAGLAGLVVVSYLLLTSAVVLGLAIALALTSVTAFAFRERLMRAPVPLVRR